MLRRLGPLLLILFAASTVFAAEVSVSDFALQTAPGMKRLPAIAAGDGGYLAVFSPPSPADRKPPGEIVACKDDAGRR